MQEMVVSQRGLLWSRATGHAQTAKLKSLSFLFNQEKAVTCIAETATATEGRRETTFVDKIKPPDVHRGVL